MRNALFLDRDGVVIEDTGFPHKITDLKLCTGVVKALRIAQIYGYSLFIVTNQSGIARGLFTLKEYKNFERYLHETLESQGVFITKTYYCPHLENSRVTEFALKCECRKPKPGLILRAANENGICLASSILVGDRNIDIEAARSAGVGRYALVSMSQESKKKLVRTDKMNSIEQPNTCGFLGSFKNLEEVILSLLLTNSL